MPELPVNKPFAPKECVRIILNRLQHYDDLNVCPACATKLAAHDLDVDIVTVYRAIEVADGAEGH